MQQSCTGPRLRHENLGSLLCLTKNKSSVYPRPCFLVPDLELWPSSIVKAWKGTIFHVKAWASRLISELKAQNISAYLAKAQHLLAEKTWSPIIVGSFQVQMTKPDFPASCCLVLSCCTFQPGILIFKCRQKIVSFCWKQVPVDDK